MRTAGSKGPVDIIAVMEGEHTMFVQCKTRKPTDREWRDAQAFARKAAKGEAEVWLVWPGEVRGQLEWVQLLP
jgi:hypothetical protein